MYFINLNCWMSHFHISLKDSLEENHSSNIVFNIAKSNELVCWNQHLPLLPSGASHRQVLHIRYLIIDTVLSASSFLSNEITNTIQHCESNKRRNWILELCEIMIGIDYAELENFRDCTLISKISLADLLGCQRAIGLLLLALIQGMEGHKNFGTPSYESFLDLSYWTFEIIWIY